MRLFSTIIRVQADALRDRNQRFHDKMPFWARILASELGRQKKDVPDAQRNVGPQPHVSLAARFASFGVPRRGRRGALAALVEEGRGEAFAAVGLRKQLLGRAMPCKCASVLDQKFLC